MRKKNKKKNYVYHTHTRKQTLHTIFCASKQKTRTVHNATAACFHCMNIIVFNIQCIHIYGKISLAADGATKMRAIVQPHYNTCFNWSEFKHLRRENVIRNKVARTWISVSNANFMCQLIVRQQRTASFLYFDIFAGIAQKYKHTQAKSKRTTRKCLFDWVRTSKNNKREIEKQREKYTLFFPFQLIESWFSTRCYNFHWIYWI